MGGAASIDAHNFNPNNLYFMGPAGNANDIMSFRISGSWQKAFGDKVGFDDFRFAEIPEVPEPTTVALLACGMFGISYFKRK